MIQYIVEVRPAVKGELVLDPDDYDEMGPLMAGNNHSFPSVVVVQVVGEES